MHIFMTTPPPSPPSLSPLSPCVSRSLSDAFVCRGTRSDGGSTHVDGGLRCLWVSSGIGNSTGERVYERTRAVRTAEAVEAEHSGHSHVPHKVCLKMCSVYVVCCVCWCGCLCVCVCSVCTCVCLCVCVLCVRMCACSSFISICCIYKLYIYII